MKQVKDWTRSAMMASKHNRDGALDPYVWATVGSEDVDLFNTQLKGFVPPGAFDAHAHLWRVVDLGVSTPSSIRPNGSESAIRATPKHNWVR